MQKYFCSWGDIKYCIGVYLYSANNYIRQTFVPCYIPGKYLFLQENCILSISLQLHQLFVPVIIYLNAIAEYKRKRIGIWIYINLNKNIQAIIGVNFYIVYFRCSSAIYVHLKWRRWSAGKFDL